VGGSRWAFVQLALVAFGFQAAAIIAVVATGNWGPEPPVALVKLNPLWAHFGQANVLLPASWFDSLSRGSVWREGLNMVAWTGIQWLVPAFVFDLLRQRSR